MRSSTKVSTLVLALLACANPTRAQEALDDLVVAAWFFGDANSGSGTRLTFRSVLDPLAKPVPGADVPTGGGTARLRIADNNKALPQDRIYFNYNHFRNALFVEPGADSSFPSQQFSIDRYTLGFEKTLFSDGFSLEIRAPVVGNYQFFSEDFGVRGSNAGNVSVITKQLLTNTQTSSSVVGLGLNLPTGSDVSGNVSDVGYVIQNEAFHFVPYLGFLSAPNDLSFYHAFCSIDVPSTGDPILASAIGQNNELLGKLTRQTLLAIDVSAGRWLYRDQSAPTLTGLATMLEFHYTTSLTDADQIGSVIDTILLEFGNQRHRFDVLNMSFGLHFEFNIDTSIRVAGSFPLREDPDRDFDAEVLVQLIHKFGTTQSRPRKSGVADLLSPLFSHGCECANCSNRCCSQQGDFGEPADG